MTLINEIPMCVIYTGEVIIGGRACHIDVWHKPHNERSEQTKGKQILNTPRLKGTKKLDKWELQTLRIKC